MADGRRIYKRLLLSPLPYADLNNQPTEHTPDQKRDARSKATPNPPPQHSSGGRGSRHHTTSAAAEAGDVGDARAVPHPVAGGGRGTRPEWESPSPWSSGRSAPPVANVGGERPASESAEGTGLIGAVARTGDASGSGIRD